MPTPVRPKGHIREVTLSPSLLYFMPARNNVLLIRSFEECTRVWDSMGAPDACYDGASV